jgi:tetratricopeptide (TPR) repeat protein
VTGGLYSARFSPDGVQIAAAAGGETIRIWDAAPGYTRELSPNLLPILAARIDADPQYDDLRLRGEILAGQAEWEQAAADLERAAELRPTSALVDASLWFTSPWWVVGPYPEVLDAEQPPETSLDPLAAVPAATSDDDSAEPLAWESIILGENQGLDLGRFFHQAEHISGYAQMRVFSPVEQSAGMLLGADDALRVWLNGELVHDRTEARAALRDDEALEVTLRQGWNTLLAKVTNSTQNHGLFLRLSADPAELARVFERTNHWERALEQWTRAAERRPGDAQLQFARGRAALFAGDDAAAVQALAAAAVNSTDLAGGWQRVSRVYRSAGRLSEATDAMAQSVAALEARLAATPDDAALRDRFVTAKTDLVVARLDQGERLWRDSRLADAVEVWQTAEDLMRSLRSDNSDDELDIARVAQANRAVVQSFVQHGLWEDAAGQADRISDGQINTDSGLYVSSIAQLFAGNRDAYREQCQRMLELAPRSDALGIKERTAKSCLLIPDAVDDLEPVYELADRVVTGTEENGLYQWCQLVKGLAEYRRGNDQGVIEWLELNRTEHQILQLNATEDLLLAMAYQRLGQADLARQRLQQAEQRMVEWSALGLGDLPASSNNFGDQMRFEILHREAVTLIHGAPPADDPALQLHRAHAFARLGRMEEASRELAAAGETAADDLNGLAIEAYVLACRGDEAAGVALTAVAERLSGQATAADGTTVDLWMTLAARRRTDRGLPEPAH